MYLFVTLFVPFLPLPDSFCLQLRPGGILCTFSCTHALATHEFFDIVKQAAHAARVDTRRLRVLSQPPDHPVTTEGDATEYLKGLALYVAESAPKSGQK